MSKTYRQIFSTLTIFSDKCLWPKNCQVCGSICLLFGLKILLIELKSTLDVLTSSTISVQNRFKSLILVSNRQIPLRSNRTNTPPRKRLSKWSHLTNGPHYLHVKHVLLVKALQTLPHVWDLPGVHVEWSHALVHVRVRDLVVGDVAGKPEAGLAIQETLKQELNVYLPYKSSHNIAYFVPSVKAS